MTYAYDLILNFNSELYEFFEWRRDDEIIHIKRINLIRVSSQCFNDIINYHVKLKDDFLLNIFNRCEYYQNKLLKNIPYALLVTDAYRAVGIILDMYGNILKYSSLLLDEEEDILELSNRLAIINIDYEKKKHRPINVFLTRYESNIIKYIKKDLMHCYQEKDLNKLKFLYYEYFNKQCDSLDVIYHSLMKELSNEISLQHHHLYQLIKLSYSHGKV